mmetsp:Transcript_25783/g.50480  ORF Transcript_25783/g.50480 Transcript_25783/m.50480 type:complete len:83 (-) Transcript_25783:151-399(-)
METLSALLPHHKPIGIFSFWAGGKGGRGGKGMERRQRSVLFLFVWDRGTAVTQSFLPYSCSLVRMSSFLAQTKEENEKGGKN